MEMHMRDDRPGVSTIDELMHASLEALRNRRVLEASILSYHATDWLLRMIIWSLGRDHGIGESRLDRIADGEMSFRHMVLALELTSPAKKLAQRLLELERERDTIMRSFFPGSAALDAREDRLRASCLKGNQINSELLELLRGSAAAS
jgi:hypothetical protein